MKTEQFINWLDNFKKAWENRNPEKAASLFSKDVVYFESPLNEPCENWDTVLKLWKVVPENQKDVNFSYEIILSDEKIAVVNWKLSRIKLPTNEKEVIDGIFLLSLDSGGLCKFFKQWRVVKMK